ERLPGFCAARVPAHHRPQRAGPRAVPAGPGRHLPPGGLAPGPVGDDGLHRRPLHYAGAGRHRPAGAAFGVDRVPDPGHHRGRGHREPGAARPPGRLADARPARVRGGVRPGARRRVRQLPAQPVRGRPGGAAGGLQRGAGGGAGAGAGDGVRGLRRAGSRDRPGEASRTRPGAGAASRDRRFVRRGRGGLRLGGGAQPVV
ncbi:MAG: hypothetical protein AVDCRST_MAG89-4716, partial [uncultured Gemmatimonadetes bacterium]